MNESTFRQKVVSRLNAVVRLMLEQAQEGAKLNITEMAVALSDAGMGPAEIGEILGKPRNHITSALSKVRKAKKGGTK